jgi:L-aspartate oxidase
MKPNQEPKVFRSDYLVIGTGISGLGFALRAASGGTVNVLSKEDPEETNTLYAQGGIAAAIAPKDSVDEHERDTLATGNGLCHPDAVRAMVEGGPAAIEELLDLGVPFTKATRGPMGLDLGQEGAHSRRRVVHAADMTGREVEEALLRTASGTEGVELFPDHFAIDLIRLAKVTGVRGQGDRCLGAYVLDKTTGVIHTFLARVTVLATGGGGKVYLYTTNSDVATGDGVAMAYRAGCSVANMEFFQFHPTCLYHPHAKSFLISEAVRGEGGILRLPDGAPVMTGVHPMADLAPRDVVARTIDRHMKEGGHDCVFLDITHRDEKFIQARFPGIHARCKELGIDMAREPIPVVPAAHYQCGGVRTDLDGRTDLPGLYAVGEVSHTGAHGANRLASNSLLEGMVFSARAAAAAAGDGAEERDHEEASVPPWDSSRAVPSDETVVVSHSWDEVRRFMWNYVGIFRSDTRLERALRRIEMIQGEIKDYYWRFIVTSDLLELRNLALVAELAVRCAMARKESRGLHYNTTHPDKDDEKWRADTVLRKRAEPVAVPIPPDGPEG